MMQPYEEYAAKAISELSPSLSIEVAPRFGITRYTEPYYNLSYRVLSDMLKSAWIAGIEYSIKLIEEEKKSPLRMRLKDPSPKFDGGGKMNEPIVYGVKKRQTNPAAIEDLEGMFFSEADIEMHLKNPNAKQLSEHLNNYILEAYNIGCDKIPPKEYR